MIYRFEDFRSRSKQGVVLRSLRYVAADTGKPLDGPDEVEPRDEFLASATREEQMEVLEAGPKPSLDPTPADEVTSAGESAYTDHDFPDEGESQDPVPDNATVDEWSQGAESNPDLLTPSSSVAADEVTPVGEPSPYLDFDLPHGDISKLIAHGVQPKDAIDAGLTHVTSSEGAFHLNRTDTGEFEGILIPYRHLGTGVSHCRVILEKPVKLKSSKGRLVSILQPVASTNHLYYVPGTIQGALDDTNVPVLLCDSEPGALAALQLGKDGELQILPVAIGGVWGWRKTARHDDPDGGDMKVEKGPVDGLTEKIAREGRRIIVAFASDHGKDAESKGGRPALVKFLKKQKAKASTLNVPAGPFDSRQDLGQWIAAAGAEAVSDAIKELLDSNSTASSTRGYAVSEDGIYAVSEKGNTTFLSSPFKVVAATRDLDGRNWGRLVEISTPVGGVQKFIIPMAELAAGGTALAEVLLGLGVRVNPNNAAKDRLALWIQLQSPESIFVTSRIGWHGKSFVLPEQTIAPPGADLIVYQGGRGVAHRYYQKGTLQESTENIGRRCVGNSRLVFAVALAFVGSLLRLVELESGGFHYQGLSSIGKTTLLRVAGSVLGGGEKGFIQSWRATSNGLEAVSELHNDSLLCLDELGQVAPEEAGRVAYMLANGQGKVRMTKEIRVRPSMEWRLVFLSTGEISLADHMLTVGRQVHAGQEVRIISIAADASKGMGCFEDLHGVASPDQFANQLNSATQAYYGTPIIAFLQRLVQECERVAEAASGFIKKSLDTHVNQRSAGEVFRAARRFALVAFAGEYASSLGITGWPEGEATKASVTCFKAWLDRRGSVGAGDIEAAIAQVRLFLTLHGGSRFETICQDDDTKVERTGARDRVGFREESPDEESITGSSDPAANSAEESEHRSYRYYILPATFRKEVCRGFDAEMVAKSLRERGHLETENGRLTYQKRLPGMGRQRVYCILPSIFIE